MKVRPVSSESEEVQHKSVELATVQFDGSANSAVKFIVDIDQVYKASHFLWIINAEVRDHLNSYIRTHGFDYIRGLVIVMQKQSVQNNGEDMTQLIYDAAKDHKFPHKNVQLSSDDGRYRSAALELLSDLDGSYPWKSLRLRVSLLTMRSGTVMSPRLFHIYRRSCNDRAGLVLLITAMGEAYSSFCCLRDWV